VERSLRPCLARRDASSAHPASALVAIETGAARSASFSEFGPISATKRSSESALRLRGAHAGGKKLTSGAPVETGKE